MRYWDKTYLWARHVLCQPSMFNTSWPPARIQRGSRPVRVLIYGATAVLLMALFFPLLGAMMDHHFAERQPGHLHIFLWGAPASHLHHHDTLHSHGDFGIAQPGAESATTILKNNVIFLPSDGEGTAGAPALGHRPGYAHFGHYHCYVAYVDTSLAAWAKTLTRCDTVLGTTPASSSLLDLPSTCKLRAIVST